ncbi:MAG: FHA domain-containing protein [Eubacterium sp.]|nr:FHA domain-containing protein [Eubacterium sp.]
MEYVVSIMRYVAPVAAAFILLTCIISLFRNRPRTHVLARLVDQNDGSIFEITHWETSIGKVKSNDIVLPLPSVSRFHAVIAKRRKDWVVFDTSSRTVGILVNGEQIESRNIIENGDIISIGTINLKFECDEALSPKSKRQIRQQVRQSAPAPSVAYAVLVDIATKRPVYIKKQDILIGRGADCDITLNSEMVSSRHARIHKTSKGWALSDLDSHNGTKLNGRYINQPQLIFDEDMLTFGDKVFIFYEK